MSSRHLTEKSDVYGFGVVLLELISGQEAINKQVSDRNPLLIEWVCAPALFCLFGKYGCSIKLLMPFLILVLAGEAPTGCRGLKNCGGSIARRQVQLRMHVENSGTGNDVCGAEGFQQTHHERRSARNPRRNRHRRDGSSSLVALLPVIGRFPWTLIEQLQPRHTYKAITT